MFKSESATRRFSYLPPPTSHPLASPPSMAKLKAPAPREPPTTNAIPERSRSRQSKYILLQTCFFPRWWLACGAAIHQVFSALPLLAFRCLRALYTSLLYYKPPPRCILIVTDGVFIEKERGRAVAIATTTAATATILVMTVKTPDVTKVAVEAAAAVGARHQVKMRPPRRHLLHHVRPFPLTPSLLLTDLSSAPLPLTHAGLIPEPTGNKPMADIKEALGWGEGRYMYFYVSGRSSEPIMSAFLPDLLI